MKPLEEMTIEELKANEQRLLRETEQLRKQNDAKEAALLNSIEELDQSIDELAQLNELNEQLSRLLDVLSKE